MDLTEFQRNMVYHGMDLLFSRPLLFYDVQKLYSILYSDGKTRESLDEAVDFFGLRKDVPFHRALEDAEYTGKILEKIEFHRVKDYVSVDYYCPPESREEEFTLEFPSYSKFVSKTFSTREQAMADKKVTDMVCYQCHRMLKKKIRWFSYGQRFYLCLAVCPEHGFIKGKIRMKRAEDGSVFAVKTLKLASQEAAEMVEKKKEEARLKRAEKSRARKH